MSTKSETQQTPFEREQLVEAGRKAYLAGLGAMAMIGERAQTLFDWLVEKGKTADLPETPDVRGMVDDATKRMKTYADKVGDAVEENTAALLHRFGVPTRDDIQVLTRRVEQLSAKVEALGGRA